MADAVYPRGLPCGLLATDTRGRVASANDTLCRWLGYSEEEAASMQLAQLLTIGGRLFHQTHLAPLLQMQGSVSEVQLQLRHRDGHAVPVLAAIARVQEEGGTVDRYAFMTSADRRKFEQELLLSRTRAESALDERRVAVDALQYKEAELQRLNTQLRLSDQRKDEFLAILGHELRNPLTPMRSGIDLLRMRKVDDPTVVRVLDVFDRQVTLMARLVEDLMDVSRIGKGKLQLQCAPVRASELVQRAVELATPLFAKAGQTLHVVPRQDGTIDGDTVRLTQVLGNLLNNASKYTLGGGTAWISYDVAGGNAVISVRDNGIGIEPARLAEVFTMFAQVESAADRAQGGIGIGLSLVKGIVELHGGTVQAHSAGAGQGSEFVVTLPTMAPVA